MSMAPMSMDGNKAQWSVSLGQGMQLYDFLWSGFGTEMVYDYHHKAIVAMQAISCYRQNLLMNLSEIT